jgi:hypothetical protein
VILDSSIRETVRVCTAPTRVPAGLCTDERAAAPPIRSRRPPFNSGFVTRNGYRTETFIGYGSLTSAEHTRWARDADIEVAQEKPYAAVSRASAYLSEWMH